MSNELRNILDEETYERLKQMAHDQHVATEAQKEKKDRTKMIESLIQRAKTRGYKAPDSRVRWKLDNAADLLGVGLVMFLGEKTEWLPEYDEVADWLSDNKGQGLLCIGSCGRGKTVITRDIMPWLFKNHIVCDLEGEGYLSHPVYSYYKADRDLKDCFNEMCRARVLCVDDLGTEPTKYYGQAKNYFDELVQNDNFERRQLLICSTNLTYEQLFGGEDPDTHVVYPERYDQRTRSRLLGCCRRVFFEGDDMRIK